MILLHIFVILTLEITDSFATSDAETFSPNSVTDSYGNTADADSQITWVNIPEWDPYETDTTYDAKGLKPIYDGAKMFIDVVQPNDVPYDLILKLIKGNFDFGSDYKEIVDYALGIAIVMGFGILFIIVFPFIGICMCCCRCFGCLEYCGGKSIARRSEQQPTRCFIFTAVLSIVTIFMGIGVLMAFVTNDTVTENIDELQNLVHSNLGDLKTYLNNTASDIEYASTTSFNFTSQVIIRDLNNIGYLVGVPIRDTLSSASGGGVDNAVNSIIALDATIQTVGPKVYAVNTSIAAVSAAANRLSSDLSSVKIDVDAALSDPSCVGCGSIDTTGLTIDFNPSDLPDIANEVSTMEAVMGKNLTKLALEGPVAGNILGHRGTPTFIFYNMGLRSACAHGEGKRTFDDIPERVENETKAVVSDVKDLLNNFIDTLSSEINEVIELPQNVSSEIDNIQTTLDDYKETIDGYNKFRWYGGCALAGMILLVCVLQFIGLCIGGNAYERRILPTEKSCISSCGGHFLIGATVLIFIFGWLLMLLTTVTFGIGANTEKCVCEPLMDDSYEIFKQLLDEPGGVFDEYFLGKTLLNNGSIALKFSDVLEGCKHNREAVSVLKLDSLFDLNTITDYRDTIDIQAELDTINVDFSTVSILSSDTEDQLNDFKSAVDINFTQILSEVEKNATQVDLQDFASQLRTAATFSTDPSKTNLNNAADDLDSIYSGSYTDTINAKNQLSTDVSDLETAAASIPTNVDNVISAAQIAENYIQANGSQLVTDEASNYANRILSIADQYANRTLDVVLNEAGSCYPLWRLWDSLVGTALCKYIIDVLNGFWYSIGWSLLCMVLSVIFNIKLAKHFRRAKELGHDYETKQSSPSYGDNKVFPA